MTTINVQENLNIVLALLEQFALDSSFLTNISLAFGEEKAATITPDGLLSALNTLPAIDIRSSDELNGALGAFSVSTGKIYLSEGILNDQDLVIRVLIEEIGHYLDNYFGGGDAAGDEGAIFAALVLGDTLNSAQLAQLKQENDHATFILDGTAIAVEIANLTGTTGNDNITGTAGDDVINGLGGNDTLSGLDGNDQLIGGAGSDTLYGGAGKDQFVLEYFNLSNDFYGRRSQNEDLVSDFVQGTDQIDVRSIGISDFATIQTLTNDDPETNSFITITVRNGLENGDYYYRLRINDITKNQLQASDFNFNATVINQTLSGTDYNDDLFGRLGNDTLQGFSGQDRLFGQQGDDQLIGGAGSDTLYGGAGKDQFVLEYFNLSNDFYGRRSQNEDLVSDFVQGTDQIDVRSIGISDFATIQTLTNDDPETNSFITITVRNGLENGDYYYRLRINDITKNQLQASDFNFNSTVINQTLSGTDYNDDLFGRLGNDTLQGFSGQDRLFGQQGDDQLIGGAGSDTLYGGAGKDQFVLEYFNLSNDFYGRRSQNEDLVSDFVQGTDQIDVRGIGISDFATIQTLTSDGSDGNALITVRNGLENGDYYYRLRINDITKNQLQASDFNFNATVINQTLSGTDYNDDLFGRLGNDTLQGFSGQDRLFGQQGDDQLIGGAGSDTLYGGAGKDQFVLEYFNLSNDYYGRRTQNEDLVSDFVQGTDQIDVRGIGISDFATIQTLTNDDPETNSFITITVRNGLENGDYYYRLRINNITKNQLQASDFNFNATVINQTLSGTDYNDDLFGRLGNDTLQGFSGQDRLFGQQGDDQLIGGAGSDTLYGGAGKDQFVLEYFNLSNDYYGRRSQNEDLVSDFVQGTDQIDVRGIGISDFATIQTLTNDDLNGNALITVRNGLENGDYYYRLRINDITKNQLQASDFNFNSTVINQTLSGTDYNDDLFGRLGNDTLQGFSGQDRLFGQQGDDQLIGGAGSDTLYGGAGKDQFVLEYFNLSNDFYGRRSQNEDLVSDFVQGTDQIDVRGIGISDFATIQTLTSDGSDGNALITVRNGLENGDYYYRLRINDITKNQLQASDFNFNSTVINQTLSGTDYNDDLFGRLGNDTLQGFSGQDRLFGQQGNDRLEGSFGNDTLYGGAGDDTAVYTGTRSQYSWSSNQGVFTITDSVVNRDGIDTLHGVQKLQFSDQIVTIAPDENSPTITLAVAPASVNEDGATNLVYTFTRDGNLTNALTVNYGIGGTATNGTDYTNIGTSVNFAANSATATVIVDPTVDTTVESNETVALTLASGTGYSIGTTTAVTGTIVNDDVTPISVTLAVAPSSVNEDGTTNLVYTFTRDGNLTNALTANYTIGGTATNGTDYTTIGTSVNFAANSNTATLTIDPTADTTIEPDETVALTLATGTGYTIGTNTAVTGTIVNDDVSSPPQISISNPAIVIEGQNANAIFTFTLSAPTSSIVSVNYATANQTARAGQDYTATNGTLTFAPNETSKTISVPILNDNINENNETFTLTLNNPTNATLNNNQAVATISDTLTSNITAILPAQVDNLQLTGTANINGTGNAGTNIIQGNSGNNQINGGAGMDMLTGGGGIDTFIFEFGQSLASAIDRITDFTIGTDKIDLLTQGGGVMNAPTQFTRAADTMASSVQNLINQLFTDANGATAGNQTLGVNSAVLARVSVGGGSGTVLLINDSNAGFQSDSDLLINVTGLTGTLPALGNISVSSFFI